MDIDDILRAAETRDSDDHPHTIGEELLSQFKVQFMNMAIFVEAVLKANGVSLRQSCIDNISQQAKFLESFQGFAGFFNQQLNMLA